MRTSLLLLLLATASAPAVAAGADDDSRQSRREAARAERSEARQERREERSESRPQVRIERSESRPEIRPEPRRETPMEVRSDVARERRGSERFEGARAGGAADADLRGMEAHRELRESRREAIEQRRSERGADVAEPAVRHREPIALRSGSALRDRMREVSPADRFERPDVEQRRRAIDNVRDLRDRPGTRPPRVVVRPPAGARPDVPAPPPTLSSSASRDRTSHGRRWHDGWRHDSRYDWWRHRSRNRWLFTLGFYFDPFGWGYHRYSRGWRLWPSYYDQNYWLNDPWMYRLPPAFGPHRWVRDWDDALLVDIYSGEVVDVIHNFFW